MENIFSIIKKIISSNYNNYNIEIIQNSIMKAITTLVFNKFNIPTKYIEDFNYNNDIYISAYFELETKLSDHQLYDDYIISKTYEFISSYKTNHKKKLSIYYTPKWIVKYMLTNTLNFQNSQTEISDLKILEPSCGAGNFIIALYDYLLDYYKENTNLKGNDIVEQISNIVIGIDKDSKAIEYTKYGLLIKIFKNVDIVDDIEFNLYKRDFIDKDFLDNIKFDFIIGNPPYLENRNIKKYYDKEYLKSNYKTANGRFDLYSLFIEKSINLLKKDGQVGFITPASLLSNNNFYNIRELILSNTNIKKIINLGEKIFQDVEMNMSIIIMKKTKINKEVIKCKNISECKFKKEQLYLKPYKKIHQNYYNNLLNYVFDINSSQKIFEMRKRIYEENIYRIKDYCDVVAGIATGNIRNKLITNKKEKSAKRVLQGKDIKPFKLNWNGLFIKDDRGLIDKEKGEYATFMRKDLIFNEKIIIRQTADKFICAYDNDNYYLLNTLYSLVVKDKYKQKIHIKYLLGLLNSKLYNFLYRSITMEDGKLFPQVKIFHIKESPIKNLPIVDQKLIVNKVNKVISLSEEKNDLKDDEIAKELNKMDHIIYDIYNISSKEIKEIEEVI